MGDVRSFRLRGSAPRLVLGALALLLSGARAARAADEDGPPPPPPPKVAETVTVEVASSGGCSLVGTYAANGAKAGSPALLLVHGEGETRRSFEPLFLSLAEHRVPWLAIDLRGHGDSAVQNGRSLASRAAARDPELLASLADDVWAGVSWLTYHKGHDKARVGVMASMLGASAAIRAAHLHKGEIAALMTLTPATIYPGLDTEAELKDQHGPMDFWVLASVEDMNRLEKKGPRHLLYVAEHARNAPPGTDFRERIKMRRGVPPHLRAFREEGIPGTKMLAGVPQLSPWIAAFWARRFATYPHPVVFDGSVDRKGDYEDLGWDGGVVVDGEEGRVRALRWGRRVMVGGTVAKGVNAVMVRVRGWRGGRQLAGARCRVMIPSGDLETQPISGGFFRGPKTHVEALALGGEEIPQKDAPPELGEASFEVEVRLPDVAGDMPYEVRVSCSPLQVASADDSTNDASGDPSTWPAVPDLLEGTGIPYVPPFETAPVIGGPQRDPPK
jgi:pimeloyl-ACP methyl ester carboxylesterase